MQIATFKFVAAGLGPPIDLRREINGALRCAYKGECKEPARRRRDVGGTVSIAEFTDAVIRAFA
jgi:hypothetical protein